MNWREASNGRRSVRRIMSRGCVARNNRARLPAAGPVGPRPMDRRGPIDGQGPIGNPAATPRTASRRVRGATSGRRLIDDQRGAYQVEYTVVLVLVAIIGAVAIAGLSVPLLHYHRSVQQVILQPVP